MAIIGLVEVCRSMSYKITGDAQPRSGMGKFESKDFFSSYKATCTPEGLDADSEELSRMAERDVMAAANYHAHFLDVPTEPGEPPTPKDSAPADVTPSDRKTGPYVVAEKREANQPPATQEATQPATATGNGTQQGAAGKAKKPATVLADKLQAAGLTKEELIASVQVYYRASCPPETKWTPEQFIEAFTATEEYIAKNGAEAFRSKVLNPPAAAEEPIPAVFTEDAATREALSQVAVKWPMWPPVLCRVAALWCADHVKSADQLAAFLATQGITEQTPAARIEPFLAITRHTSMGTATKLVDYCKRSNKPMQQIEEELSKTVGSPIRFAMELPRDAVIDALAAMIEAK